MSQTLQVGLRDVAECDRNRLRTWRNQPDVRRWMYSDHEISEPEHASWFNLLIGEARRRHWIIEVDEAPVGLVNLYGLDPQHDRGSWAYYIAEQSVRGRGVGAAVEYLTLERAFSEFGLHKLWCEVLSDNEPVIRLHESFGFQREALFRDHILKEGQRIAVIGLGLLAPEWASRREDSHARLLDKGLRFAPSV